MQTKPITRSRTECSVPGCARFVNTDGLCAMHHKRWKNHGTVGTVGPRVFPETCIIDNCNAPARSRGWCENHYSRWLRRGGDPALRIETPSHLTHGHTRYLSMSPTYSSWNAMISRCHYKANLQWKNYGGRGITICARWNPRLGGCFANFLADMGEKPTNPEGWTGKRSYWSLDRIDVNGNYEPGNCRWATPAQQAANLRPRIDIAARMLAGAPVALREVAG